MLENDDEQYVLYEYTHRETVSCMLDPAVAADVSFEGRLLYFLEGEQVDVIGPRIVFFDVDFADSDQKMTTDRAWWLTEWLKSLVCEAFHGFRQNHGWTVREQPLAGKFFLSRCPTTCVVDRTAIPICFSGTINYLREGNDVEVLESDVDFDTTGLSTDERYCVSKDYDRIKLHLRAALAYEFIKCCQRNDWNARWSIGDEIPYKNH